MINNHAANVGNADDILWYPASFLLILPAQKNLNSFESRSGKISLSTNQGYELTSLSFSISASSI